ncbi:hypothetical protein [Arcobacter sp. FWKO B]|uniref:hypothetical protein n=1 Tax=Arcobacter sp. FWKO B TaxID=2593672 RepID=UPI0018A5912B|nr:hypothetical protein [Arcobacter sp. FWKO B]QOG11482.1 hypothetical protein FWKOB_01700 [Arcobacter sp. FWKO B]
MSYYNGENLNWYESWVEADLNPFMTFYSNGKIKYTNNEAQFLLNRISPKEIFDIAMQYAPVTYGFSTSYINLTFQNYQFYAITVGYEDDEIIGIKLYKSNVVKKENVFTTSGDISNIFTLIELAISTNKLKSSANFIKNYDPSIPEFRLMINDFLKLLNATYEVFLNSTQITTSVKLKVGEFLKINNEKYSLIGVEIKGDKIVQNGFDIVENFAIKYGFAYSYTTDSIEFNLPLILK